MSTDLKRLFSDIARHLCESGKSRSNLRRKGIRLESLEPRMVLNAAPVATPDYLTTTVEDGFLVDYLLLNDTDTDGDTLNFDSFTQGTHGTVSQTVNVAASGTASQSSTAFGGNASRALDGNTSGVWSNGSITHTDNLANSWWEVDLGQTENNLSQIVLFNRADGSLGQRLSNFRVSVFDGSTEVFGQDYFQTGHAGASFAIDLPQGISGDRVRVQLNGLNNVGNGYLSLAEVQVMQSLPGWTYTPDPGFTGSDSFTYTVSDGNGGTDVGTVTVSVNTAIDAEAARDALLAGVTTLANPTQPSYAIAYGPSAYSIAMYDGTQQTMIAAASWGSGKVVAMPDHQWLNMGSYGDTADMGTFYTNSIEWLAGVTSLDIKIVVRDSGTQTWLQNQGYTNVVLTNWTNLATDLSGADVFVAGWLGSSVSQTNLDTIADYTRGGGGLFIAEYGVGYNWWWGKPISEAPGNLLLREAGIGFTSGNRWDSGTFTVNRSTGEVNADTLLAILEDSSGYSSTELDQAGVLLTGLGEVLAADDSLLAQVDEGFWARIDTINPTPATPVTDSFEKSLLTREMQLIQNLSPDQVTAHRTAEEVYGTIDPQAPRLGNQQVTIDANKTGMIATGYYAVPGEVVTITVPSTLVGQGYNVRISGHSDNISGRSSWDRVPFGVQRSYALDSTTIDIASAFGGQIYIDLGGQAGGSSPGLGNQTITIDGAIAAPLFILGETTDQDWINSIRDNPAPYAEFVSDHLAFSVPSAWIRDLDNPTAIMQYWDDAVAFQDWVGGFDILRTGPDRINLDVQISGGLLHAGYPIQGPTWYGSSIVNLDALEAGGDWGWFHELGHEMQRHPELGWGWDNPWTFSGDVEVTVNIFANAALEQMIPGVGTGGWGWSAHPNEVMTRAANTVNDTGAPNFDSKDPYPFYFQLADGPWGWQGYRDVLSSYVDDAQNNPGNLPSTNQEEKDQWLIRWSEQTGYDMTEYMVDNWGLEVSASALGTVAAMSLPSWMPLATSISSAQVLPGGSETFDLASAGLSLDGVATLVNVGSASHGTLTDNGDGTYTYQANAGYQGADSFSVTYQSSAGNQQAFTVELNVSSSGVLMETFYNISGTAVSALTGSANYPDSPDATAIAERFESPTNAADNYGVRMRAYVTAPTTGNYTFWIASDDNGELRLSTDEDPANASLIANVPGWTSSQQWTKYASQQSTTISLVAGERYYIEALMKEGGGGDNLAVAWSGPGISGPTVIDGQYLTAYAPQPGVLMETFNNISGTTVSDLTGSANYPNSPDATAIVGSFESPTNAADNYGLRMRSHLKAPLTGDYTFWIASDDNGQLLLSTDTDPANATPIASVPGWTNSREWTKYASQQSTTISLLAGQHYYIEALMKEGGGGDNLAVAWSGPGISGPVVIDGQYLTAYMAPPAQSQQMSTAAVDTFFAENEGSATMAEDELTNGGFESGLTDWQSIGSASVEDSDWGIDPDEGLQQALLTNGRGALDRSAIESLLGLASGVLDGKGNGNVTEGSAIYRTVTVTAGTTLSFRYNYVTREYANDPTYNDFAFLSVAGGTTNDLLELADTSSLTPNDAPNPYRRSTGYLIYEYTFTESGTYTIGFGVMDSGDTNWDTALLLDDIEFV